MDHPENNSEKDSLVRDYFDKCPECKENTLKTQVTEWGGLTRYVLKYCTNCGFQDKTIESLY